MTGIPPLLAFLAGLLAVIGGAELILRGATRTAALLGVRPIVIGLTVVSVGTSTPELAVGLTAAAEGRGSLAVGNIAGANIINILFILGLSALIRPLPLRLLSIRLDVPVMILTALLLYAMAVDGVLSRGDGLILLAGAALYTLTMVRLSRRESRAMEAGFEAEFQVAAPPQAARGYAARNAVLLVAGIAVTVVGADLLVAGAVDIATAYGIPDAVIGLTIVAFGTTAPELATTLVGTLRNDRDVAIGNLIGSSIYNILVILGATCLVAERGVAVGGDILRIDLPLAAAVAIACYPVFRSDRLVSRREGALFVLAYLAYLGTLIGMRA